MREYKMVCSDIDGTLLSSEYALSSENLAAMEQLMAQEIWFVPSTGRTFSEVPEKIRTHPFIRYYIYSNGAVVFDKLANRYHRTCICNAVSQQILEILNRYETHISVRHNGDCCVDAAYANKEAFDYYNVCEAHQVVVNAFSVLRENFREYCQHADEVEVISVFFHRYDDLLEARRKLEDLGGLRVVGVSEYNLEIMNAQAGKGNALLWLAQQLGIDRKNTISVGDTDNDQSIIEAAGLGLAVSNACERLKTVADEVICSNDEHAIAYILSHYFMAE